MTSNKFHRLLTVALMAALTTIAVGWSHTAAAANFAVIDLRRAVSETEDGLRLQAKLQALFDSRQAELEKKKVAYDAAKDKLEKMSKKPKGREMELRKGLAKLERQAMELQQLQSGYTRELQQRRDRLMMPMFKRTISLVGRLAAKNGYDMVLNKEAVPYVRSDLDITDRIIQMYNAESAGGAPKKAPPAKRAPRKAAPKAGAPAAPRKRR